MVYLPTLHIKSTIHVGKYTSPMDPMGQYEWHFFLESHALLLVSVVDSRDFKIFKI